MPADFYPDSLSEAWESTTLMQEALALRRATAQELREKDPVSAQLLLDLPLRFTTSVQGAVLRDLPGGRLELHPDVWGSLPESARIALLRGAVRAVVRKARTQGATSLLEVRTLLKGRSFVSLSDLGVGEVRQVGRGEDGRETERGD